MATKEIKAVQRLIKLEADSTGELIVPDRIHLMSVGHWHTPWHGAFEMTATDLADMVINFEGGIGSVEGSKKLPINYGHDISGKAAGWVTGLSLENNGTELWGDIEWTPYGKKMLADKEFRYISPEWNPRDFPWEDPEVEGNFVDNVFTGAGLTNIPLFKALTPIMASVDAAGGGDNQTKPKGGDMTLVLEEVRVKKLEELSDEEKAFLVEHQSELTDEERTQFEIVDDEAEKKAKEEAEAKAAAEKEAAEQAEAEKKAADEKASLEASTKGMTKEQKAEFITLKASVATLEAKAAKGEEAAKELLKTQLTASVTKHAERGAIKTDQIEPTVEMLMASTEPVREQMTSFLDKLPDNKLVTEGEQGKSGLKASEDIELTEVEKSLAADFNLSPEELIEYKKNKASKE